MLKKDVQVDSLKVILFMALMLLIIEMSPIITSFFSGEMYEIIGLLTFFATFFFMYLVIEIFTQWDGESVSKLGIDTDDETKHQIIVGAFAAIISAVLVFGIAFVYGASLRSMEQINADLIASEIIITTPTAIFEELAHRGYILSRLEKLTGQTNAILVSSIFFAFSHFSWWTYPAVNSLLIVIFSFNMFLGGVILSLSYYWSGRKLWVAISFHFAWNMLAYILFPRFPVDTVVQPEIFQIEWGLTTILGFFLGLSLLYGLLQTKKK